MIENLLEDAQVPLILVDRVGIVAGKMRSVYNALLCDDIDFKCSFVSPPDKRVQDFLQSANCLESLKLGGRLDYLDENFQQEFFNFEDFHQQALQNLKQLIQTSENLANSGIKIYFENRNQAPDAVLKEYVTEVERLRQKLSDYETEGNFEGKPQQHTSNEKSKQKQILYDLMTEQGQDRKQRVQKQLEQELEEYIAAHLTERIYRNQLLFIVYQFLQFYQLYSKIQLQLFKVLNNAILVLSIVLQFSFMQYLKPRHFYTKVALLFLLFQTFS